MPPAPRRDVVFVAEVEGHPAGYMALREDGSALVVDQIVVAPADQGRRVGNRLLDWAEGYGTSRGKTGCASRPPAPTGGRASSTPAAAISTPTGRSSARFRTSTPDRGRLRPDRPRYLAIRGVGDHWTSTPVSAPSGSASATAGGPQRWHAWIPRTRGAGVRADVTATRTSIPTAVSTHTSGG